MKFRKKSIEIEAQQFDGSWACAQQILKWIEDSSPIDRSGPRWADRGGGVIFINTLEGEMCASAGDWIIKGLKGEFYPCKPDVFNASYDAVDTRHECWGEAARVI